MKRFFKVIIVIFVLAILAIVAGPKLINSAMRLRYPLEYENIVQENAQRYDLEEPLICAMIWTESKFDQDAVSHAGAKGLMQLTDGTFDWITDKAGIYGPDLNIWSPADNIQAGCALIRFLLDRYGSLEVALSAYNAGIGNVSEWLNNDEYSNDGQTLHTIPFKETENYIRRVSQSYIIYQNLYFSAEQ